MEKNICLLLGAGVSVEQKLPQWLDLVKGVIKYYNIKLGVDKDNLIESIGIIEDNRLNEIHKRLVDSENININERTWARRKIALATRMCLKKQLINSSFDEVKGRMKLMYEVAQSVYERTQKGLITTIITYNFDDYFEFAYKCILKENNKLGEYDKQLSSYTIGEEEQHLPSGVQEKLVNVYHVHGCIPVFDELYGFEFTGETMDEYKQKNVKLYQDYLNHGVIFSGNDYNLLLDDSIVGWTNMIQYICYSQLPLSILGFSLTDANFRMLLRRMRKSKNVSKDIMIFLGYGTEEQKSQTTTSAQTADYLFKGICDKPQYSVNKFGCEMSEAVKNHLKKYL